MHRFGAITANNSRCMRHTELVGYDTKPDLLKKLLVSCESLRKLPSLVRTKSIIKLKVAIFKLDWG